MSTEPHQDWREFEHEQTLAYEDEPHSENCYLTGCEECREERMLRGLDVPPLRIPEWVYERQGTLDEDAWRIGEGTFEGHFFNIERIERRSEVL